MTAWIPSPRTEAAAHWTCGPCRLTTEPATGPTAEEETKLLATVHDTVHHGRARTAQVLTGTVTEAPRG